jgi:tetratricopeptide (TPR) repeat protein
MPNSSPFIVRLKSILPEETWPWVISALRKDELVWQSLEEVEFSQRALNQIGANPEDWTPAALALVSLRQEPDADLSGLDPDLRQESLRAYDEVIHSSSGTPARAVSLSRVGLVALALNQQRVLTGSWDGPLSDLGSLPDVAAECCSACLYGLVDAPDDLLQALMSPEMPHRTHTLALHAVLSTPVPLTEHAKTLHPLLEGLPLADCLGALTYLKKYRPDFATRLARLFLEKQPTIPNRRKYSQYTGYLNQIAQLLRNAEIHLIAELPSQASSLRSLAMEVTKRLHADIALQIAGNRAQRGDLDAAMSIWQNSEDLQLPEASRPIVRPPIELILALLKKGHFDDALALVDDQDPAGSQSALLHSLISAHRLAVQAQLSPARKAALRALQEARGQVEADRQIRDEDASLEVTTGIPVIKELAGLLLDLSLPRDAVQAYDLALMLEPDQPELLQMRSEAQRLDGDAAAAVATSHLAVALDPDQTELRRELIASLESAGDWNDALEQRTILLEERFRQANQNLWPAIKDLQDLAACALRAGQAQRCIKVCQQLLELDSADGLALAILGEALASAGELEEGLEQLQKATQTAPHLSLPWIALARVRKNAGESAKAIETLRAACNAVPGNPEIFLALAEAYLAEDSLTQALASLRRAYEIISNDLPNDSPPSPEFSMRVAMQLGHTLTQLGHLDEAQQVLEKAYLEHPTFSGIAYAYARCLLSLDEPDEALEPLRTAMQEQPAKPEVFLDYARALLAVNDQAGEAVSVLRTAILLSEKSDPSLQAIAQGLLAEALAADGETNAALQAYYQALETQLADDPDWRARLSLGLGLVTLKLNQPEIAVASLQEAARLDANNPLVQQKLAEAYAATDLPDEALEAARIARDLAHEDVDLLAWFAEQALVLDAPEEAIDALSQVIHIDAQRTDLVIQLGQIYSQLGEKEAALEVLRAVVAAEDPSFEECYRTAQLLLNLGDAAAATTCLERAKQLSRDPDPALLQYLAISYHESGDIQRGLETLDYAIDLDPGNLSLYLLKADLLGSMGQPEDAQNTLEHTLDLFPNNPDVHYRIAQMLRSNGHIASALHNAEQVVAAYQDTPLAPQAFAARALAAGLARGLLRIDYARSLLSVESPPGELPGAPKEEDPLPDRPISEPVDQGTLPGSEAYLDYYCLSAEMALEQSEEIAAAEALTQAIEIDPDHPRATALQARLTLRRGDHTTGAQILQTALESISREDKAVPASQPGSIHKPRQAELFAAAAAAAVEFHEWDVALQLARRSIMMAPKEPFFHVQVARTLVLRAEFQRLCETLQVIAHAPGPSSWSESAHKSYEEALLEAVQCMPADVQGDPMDGGLIIARWRARGQAVFHPNHESLKALEGLTVYSADDHAALIALLRQLGDLATIANIYQESNEGRRKLPRHHRVLAQLALSLGYNGRRQDDLSESINAARTALDQQPGQPLYHILLALLIERNGDPQIALRSAQTAISIWPDEPRWHALAAGFHLESGDAAAAIAHLKKATHLEPQYLSHYLSLGQGCLKHGDVDQAIQAFEQAQRIDPRQIKSYLWLAQIYLSQGDLRRAAASADSAIKLAPDQIDPLLVRAEIALQANDPQAALRRSQAALEIDPEDVSALHLQARCLERLGQTEEAVRVLDRALTLTEDALPLMLERIDLVESSLGLPAALTELQKLAARHPDEASVLARLSRALAEAGMHTQAISTAQSALRSAQSALRDESLHEDEKGDLHFLLGQLLRAAGQLDQAIYQINEAIRLAPENVEAYLELAAAHQDRRQYAQALEVYQQAMQMAPGDPRLYYQAGLMLKENHDYAGAEEMLRQAAGLAHDDPTIHRQLAAIVALNLVHNRRNVPIDL